MKSVGNLRRAPLHNLRFAAPNTKKSKFSLRVKSSSLNHPPHIRNTTSAPFVSTTFAMKNDKLSVTAKDVPQIHPPSPRSPRLPREDPAVIRGLALKAGWNLQMLQNSAHVPRKCPVLPSFIPRAVGQGLTVSGFDQSKQDDYNGLFHGNEVASPPQTGCPFQENAAAQSSEKD